MFRPVCEFLEQHWSPDPGAATLVHCRAGIHRSPAMVAAFILYMDIARGAGVSG